MLRIIRISAYGCLYKRLCVDELVKLYLRISFSNKEIHSLLVHKQCFAKCWD